MILRSFPVLALVAAATPAVTAQEAELRLLGGEITDASGGVHRALGVEPAAWWSADGVWIYLAGHGSVLENGGHILGVSGRAHGTLARVGPGEVAVRVGGSATRSSGGFRSLAGEVKPRVQVGTAAAGAAVGAGLAGATRTVTEGRPLLPGQRSRSEETAARTLEGEAWWSGGPLAARFSGREIEGMGLRWREAAVSLTVARDRVEMGVTGGLRNGDLAAGWIGASMDATLRPGLALLVQGGSYPENPLTGEAAGRRLRVGMRLATSRSTPEARRDVRVVLRDRPGAEVELLADWNDWQPEPVAGRGDGVHEVWLQLPPGAYRFIFRVDGEWRVPEGYDTEPDDFGGRSAVIHVPG